MVQKLVLMKHRYPSKLLVASLRGIWLMILSLSTTLAFAQPGKNGAMTITATNTVVNCYSIVTANVTAGSTTIVTDNSCTLECGDLVMVYQAQGASINTTNTDQYGTITGYNNSGLYEFNYVVSAAGGTVTVQTPWANSYTAAGKVQLVKVPQYTTLTVNASGSIVPAAWQDSGTSRKGGIVAIHATGTVTINGVVSASGFAFRAGAVEQNTSAAGNGIQTDYVSTSSSASAEKGESIAGFGPEYDGLSGRYGRGAPANGGGGGNGHNAGGGGGSNANNGNVYNGNGIMCTGCTGSAAWSLDPFVIANGNVLANSSGGGRGGYTYSSSNQNALTLAPSNGSWGGDNRDAVGGYGGRPLTITAGSRIFFGGGGGTGDSNNSGNQPGGKGGGIVCIIAPNITGSGTISANGAAAVNQISTNNACANDAPGGGGGGGSVILKSTVAGTLTVTATGGKGGDQGFLSSESEGPGGGGGGGYVAITSGTPTINIAGGDNGITLSGSLTEFTPNGATIGAAGQSATVAATFLTYIPVNITASANTPVCAGSAINFTTNVNVGGGTYAWTGPASFTSAAANPTIASATVAHTGTYRVIYTSPGGCPDTAFVSVVVNPTPVANTTIVNPLCNTSCNGSATINFTTAGTAPYVYNWSNGQVTQTASNLCAGNYTVTITDANNCTASTSAAIVAPPALGASSVVTNVSCNGGCNGTVTITATGGTGTKQYSLNSGPFQASNVFTGLCANSYTVVIRDANNCTFTHNFTVTQSGTLTLNLVGTTPATCGSATGSITVQATGGTLPYSFSMGGAGQPGATFSNVGAGSYTITVTDANGCTQTVPATVLSSGSPTATIIFQQNVSCFGGSNGAVLVGVTGGTGPFTYKLDANPPQASNSFTTLAAGNHTIIVTDANLCTSTVNFTITSPTQLTYTSAVTATTCNGTCDGQVQINVSGGTAPFQYSNNNGTTFTPANPITGLCPGVVNIVVQDANGCLANSVVNIPQPAPLTATLVATDPTCHDACNGQVVMTPAGGTATYQYSANGGPLQSSPTLTDLCPGPQQLMVQDIRGCQFTATTTLANPPGITITLNDMVESNCGFNNGSLDVTATGLNAPFQYSMNGLPSQPTGVFGFLLAGAYNIVVTDAIGCTDSMFFGVNDIEMAGILLTMTDVTCFGGSDGTVEVTNVSGAPPITFELDNSGTTQTSGLFIGLAEGSHIVTIYDGGLCVFTIPFQTIQPEDITYNTTITDVVCNGGSSGEVNFNTLAGGTPGYQYSIDNGTTFQPGATFTGLMAGTYDVAVIDINSCVVYGSVTIDEATPVTFTSNTADLTCNGNLGGAIILDGAGGNGGYTYSIDNGTTFTGTSGFFSLPAGTYPIVVRDQLLCDATGSLVLTEPPLLTAVYATTPVSCSSICDGTITMTAAGGTGAYQYSVDNGVTYGVTPTVDSLCAGSYNLRVRDQENCMVTSLQAIASPTPVTFTTTLTSSTCSSNNGIIQINANGGTGGYQYSIDNGATFVGGNTFNNLLAGNYIVVVQDANGCSEDATVTLLDQASPQITNAVAVEPLCNGNCNGQLSVITTGGTGTLQYSIGGPNQLGNTFNSLCAGNYSVTIIDANGCTDTLPVVLGEPAALTFTSIGTNLTCFQNSTGTVEVNAAGGTIPYMYSYDNGTSFTASSTLNFIAAGTYNLVVRDQHNCLVTGSQVITEPTQLTGNVTTTNATCFAAQNGLATVNASGGTVAADYTYTWSSNVVTSNGSQANSLGADSYSVQTTDDNGCFIDLNFVITEPAQLIINSVSMTEPSCNGLCDGSITINSPTAVTFSFDGGATSGPSNTLNNICAGNYNVQVTNLAGCVANSTVNVSEPLPLQIFSTPDSLMCAGDTIPLFAIAFGGTQPYAYIWSNGANQHMQDVYPVTPASYSVHATDAHGCTTVDSTTNLTMLQSLSFNVTADTSICEGNTIVLEVTSVDGYPDYTYQWSTGTNDTLTTVTVTPDAPTTYTISVTDRCLTVDSTIDVSFYAIPQVTMNPNNADGCSPLTVTFTPGVNPALLTDCLWTFSNGQTSTNCSSITATFTEPGCYDATYTGTSSDGCPISASFQDVACVYPDPVANFTYNPFMPSVLNSQVQFLDLSQDADSFFWTFGGYGVSTEENPSHNFINMTPNDEIAVCLEVTSPAGCVDSICRMITFSDDFVMYVPNTFTPDGDAYNNTFQPVFPEGAKIDKYSLIIFDRWGEIIFESLNYEIGWDGTYAGQIVKDGVFTWVIEIGEGFRNTQQKFIGHVNVLQ
jgi:large repetitive protein